MPDLKVAAELLQECLRVHAPYDTGNLALNSIRIMYDTNGDIFVAIGGEIAPYAVYTNEKWVAEKWQGKQNPNAGWIEYAINEAIPLIKGYLSQDISQQDFNQWIEYYKNTFNAAQNIRLQGR